MYEVDSRYRVVEFDEVPKSSVGAPLPVVVASERMLMVAYLAAAGEPDWGRVSIDDVDLSAPEQLIVIQFESPYAWFHGAPNDEAFSGHPLAARGLSPYGLSGSSSPRGSASSCG